jgi:hypothetical protein
VLLAPICLQSIAIFDYISTPQSVFFCHNEPFANGRMDGARLVYTSIMPYDAGYAPCVVRLGPECQITLRTNGREKSRPSRTRGQWGEPYGVAVHMKRGELIIHSFIHSYDVTFPLHHMA